MIRKIVSNQIEENCYLIEDENGIVIIDPGCGVHEKIAHITQGKRDLSIIITHGHADHIFDADLINADSIYIHPMDFDHLFDEHKSLLKYFGKKTLNIERSIVKNCKLLENRWKVFHTPGHTPGSCCYLYNESILFSGDTVFSNSIGRCDLPGGDEKEMSKSVDFIKGFLIGNPDIKILPGHGPETNAKLILLENPFFR